MYSRETYFKVKQEIIYSGLSIPGYFKKIHKSASSFYKSKNIFDSDCEIKPIFVTKIEGQDEIENEPLSLSLYIGLINQAYRSI